MTYRLPALCESHIGKNGRDCVGFDRIREQWADQLRLSVARDLILGGIVWSGLLVGKKKPRSSGLCAQRNL